jgi:hypothetical protein
MTTRILKAGVSREEVSGALLAMGLARGTPGEVPEDMFVERWLTPDGGTAVNHIDDAYTETHTLECHGDAEDALAEKLEEVLPVWDQGELVTHADRVLEEGPDEARKLHGDVPCNHGDPVLDVLADALDAFKKKKAEEKKE